MSQLWAVLGCALVLVVFGALAILVLQLRVLEQSRHLDDTAAKLHEQRDFAARLLRENRELKQMVRSLRADVGILKRKLLLQQGAQGAENEKALQEQGFLRKSWSGRRESNPRYQLGKLE